MKAKIGDIFYWKSSEFWSIDVVTGVPDLNGQYPLKALAGDYPFKTISSDLYGENWTNITSNLSRLLFIGRSSE